MYEGTMWKNEEQGFRQLTSSTSLRLDPICYEHEMPVQEQQRERYIITF